MTNLTTVVEATRASAQALGSIQKWARKAADACAVLESNHRRVALGLITPEAAAIGNRIAEANKARAVRAVRQAEGRYAAAQARLAANPL